MGCVPGRTGRVEAGRTVELKGTAAAAAAADCSRRRSLAAVGARHHSHGLGRRNSRCSTWRLSYEGRRGKVGAQE